MKIPELLIPANNLNVLKYAIAYGADAVYIGGEDFNLRNLGQNFSNEEIKTAVDYAHKKGVKIYFTLNAFIHEDEIESIKSYIKELRSTGIDAVIVSDPGVFDMVKELIPEIDIHISTQANNTNHKSVNFWGNIGAKRVNIAREVKYENLIKILSNTSIEIELFVHGAMCISYSGRCMLSKYLSGRDANRGECAHSCRWNYYLMEEERPNLFLNIEQSKRGTNIYNSRDLCLMEKLDILVESGVNALKVEGRMKTENYVSTVTWAYRRALDNIEKRKNIKEEIDILKGELEKISHRNYTTGFMFNEDKKELEDNENVGYIRNSNFIGNWIDYDRENNGPVINVRNRIEKEDIVDILEPGKLPVKMRIREMLSAKNRENIEYANPNDTIILKGLGKFDKYSIFRKNIIGTRLK